MKCMLLRCLLVLFAVSFASGANNDIRVDITKKSTGPCTGGTTTLYVEKDTNFTINISSCDDLINIWDHDNDGILEGIGRVTINGSGATTLKVFIGSGTFPTTNIDMTPAASNFGGLAFNSPSQQSATTFSGSISGNLTGSVSVGIMQRFEVDGQVQAGIFGEVPGSLVAFDIQTGSMSSDGYVLCGEGNILRVVAHTGDLAGV